jgi:UDP-glucose 4-epimerase/GDP-4-dehydro-6-deoxy-D-mannose reductase
MSMNLSDLIPRPEFLTEFKDWASTRDVRVAITGANGTLGTLLLERFSRAGMQVSCFKGDVTNGSQLRDWIASSRPQALFHLAAVVPLSVVEEDPIRAMQVNATSLLTLVSAIKDHAPDCWLFFASTSHVYQSSELPLTETSSTNPSSLYGATKLAGEAVLRPLAKCLSIKMCIARIFSYFHERQDESFLVPGIVKKVESSPQFGSIELYNTQATRDFLHASMVVDAILHAFGSRYAGTVNVASGHGTSVREIAERVILGSGKDLTIRPIDVGPQTTIVADITRLKTMCLAHTP